MCLCVQVRDARDARIAHRQGVKNCTAVVDLVGARAIWEDEYFTDDADDSGCLQEQEAPPTHAYTGRVRTAAARSASSMRHTTLIQHLMSGCLDPHTMVACEAYGVSRQMGRRGGGDAIYHQPFEVKIMPDVPFITDLHAHLSDAEVIGYLAGKWDAKARIVYIQAAFPCRALETLETGDGATDVEMDPSSDIHVREIIALQNMEVVGWYHSHPTFQPDPSITDISNQANYQKLFQDKETGLHPFVGLIVSTYDPALVNAHSVHRYFHVRREVKNQQDIFLSMELSVTIMYGAHDV
jgi:proteasome lid subunit RPN8/RPN11